MKINLNGKNVFMTGASRGIGKEICETLRICCVGGITAPSRSELDLKDKNSIMDYLNKNVCLSPDVFIHCAGVNQLAGIEEISRNILDESFAVNCFAPIELLHKFAKDMKDRRNGRIVFISSLYAEVSKERRIAYSSSKSALNGLMKSLALELAPYNVLVNAVAPGYVMTEMTKKNLSQEEIAQIESQIPQRRFQNPSDIANLVAFLCSDLNQSITGQWIAVDGGFLCR